MGFSTQAPGCAECPTRRGAGGHCPGIFSMRRSALARATLSPRPVPSSSHATQKNHADPKSERSAELGAASLDRETNQPAHGRVSSLHAKRTRPIRSRAWPQALASCFPGDNRPRSYTRPPSPGGWGRCAHHLHPMPLSLKSCAKPPKQRHPASSRSATGTNMEPPCLADYQRIPCVNCLLMSNSDGTGNARPATRSRHLRVEPWHASYASIPPRLLPSASGCTPLVERI